MPLGIRKGQQRDFVSQSRKREGKIGSLFDPVMKRGEEKNVLSRLCIFNEWLDLLDRVRQGFRQARKIVVILASAILLPESIIELGSERQFTDEVAERGFIEHIMYRWLSRASDFLTRIETNRFQEYFG